MKRNLLVAMILGANCLMPSAQLFAQSRRERADVPFPFVVSDRTLPAGRYTVSQITGTPVFSFSGNDGKTLFTQLGSQTTGNPANPSLTFACRAGQDCVLIKVTPPDTSVAYGLTGLSDRAQKLHMVSMISIALKSR